MARQVAEFEFEDWGVDRCDYFPGATCMPSNYYDEAIVGIGDNPWEALEDAIDNAVISDWAAENVPNEQPKTPSAYQTDISETAIVEHLTRVKAEELLEEQGELPLLYYFILYLREGRPTPYGKAAATA